MLKVAVVIAIIGTIYAGLYSLTAIIAPKVMMQSTFEAVTGKTVESVQDVDCLRVVSKQTRAAGFYALTAVIFAFFILFVGFRKAQKWAWWAFLIGAGIAWLWGIIDGIVTGNNLHLLLHAIGLVLLLVAGLLPIKVFFAKEAQESQEA